MTLLKDATEAVKTQIESTGLNYDNDSNGQIDNGCYIIQGATDGWSDLLWPHKFQLYSYNMTIGGATVWNYNLYLLILSPDIKSSPPTALRNILW